MWKEALDVFLNNYSPCDKLEDSNCQFTTFQLQNMLDQHCGGYVNTEELTKHLTEKKFTYQYTHELVMEWLFKDKTAE